MKNARLIAERYAQALSQAVPDDAVIARVRDDVMQLAQIAAESAELRAVLGNPVIAPDQKAAVMRALAGRLGARPETTRFLDTLATHERLGLLDEIAEAVKRAVDRRAGVVEVEVRSASALDDALRARLAPVLARLARAKVRTREVVDPALIGGMVVRVGGTVYDGSVASRLEKMKARLAGGGGALH